MSKKFIVILLLIPVVVFALSYMLCTPSFMGLQLHRFLNKSTTSTEKHTQILFDVADSLEREGIFFWLGEGTALGAIRQQNVIPGDSDVDIGIYTKDKSRFINRVLPALYKKGFLTGRRYVPHTLHRDGHFIDIDFTSPRKKCAAIHWKQNCDKVLKVLEPFQSCIISDRTFICPSMSYIHRLYGDDWETPKPHFKPIQINK